MNQIRKQKTDQAMGQKTDRLKIAACGIDCSQCGSYKVTMENDREAAESLVAWYRNQGWIGQEESADAVLRKNPICKGCWNGSEDCFFKCGCHPGRDFRACCREKQISHCGECRAFPCGSYLEFVGDLEHHRKAMERLLALREQREQ